MKIMYFVLAVALLALLPGHAQAYYGGDLDIESDITSVCPCDIISSSEIAVKLTNYGTKTDTFYLSVEVPEDWSAFVMPEVTLASGESVMIDPAWVAPPCGTLPGTYTVKFKAVSAMSGKITEKELDLDVMMCHAVEITGRDFSTCEGVKKSVSIDVSNSGNLEDTFTLTASPSWVSVSPSSVTLGELQTKEVTLTAIPPESFSGALNVTVTALAMNTYARTEESMRLDVNRCNYFAASMVPPEGSVCIGDEATYYLSIDNKGTTADRYVIAAPSWVDVSENNVTVRSRARKMVTLTASPESPGLKSIDVYVSSVDHPTEIVKVESIALVSDCRDASVSLVPDRLEVCNGQPSSFSVNLTNTGNVPAKFDMRVSTGGPFSSEKVELAPGERQELAIEMDGSKAPGRYPVDVVVLVGNRTVAAADAIYTVRNCYDAVVHAAPFAGGLCQGDVLEYDVMIENRGTMADAYNLSYPGGSVVVSAGAGKNATAAVDIDVGYPWSSENTVTFSAVSGHGPVFTKDVVLNVSSVSECYSVRVDAVAAGEQVDVAKGFGVPVKLSVTNLGTRSDDYAISLGGPDWAHITADSLSLDSGESGTVYIYLSPPYDVSDENYTMVVLAESGNAFSRLELNATVIDRLMSGGEPEEGETGQFTGLFLLGSAMALQIAVVSAIALLTVVVVLMRFVVFR